MKAILATLFLTLSLTSSFSLARGDDDLVPILTMTCSTEVGLYALVYNTLQGTQVRIYENHIPLKYHSFKIEGSISGYILVNKKTHESFAAKCERIPEP